MVRQKNRYILCEVVTPDNTNKQTFSDGDVYTAVRQMVQTLHGDFGIGSLLSALYVKYYNPDTGIIIIRASRSAYKLVISSLPIISKIKQEDAFFKVLHIGGTIRTCQKFVVRYHRQQLIQLLRTTSDPGERQKIQAMLLASDKPSKTGNTAEVEAMEEDLDSDS